MPGPQWQIHPSPPTSWRSPTALENLHLSPSPPSPSPSTLQPNEVLIKIQAASINARDLMVIAHDPIYPIHNIDNLVPCADGAGIVEAVGSTVDSSRGWKVGDRVLIHPSGWMEGDVPDLVGLEGKGAGGVQGTLRGWGVFPAEHLIPAPKHLTFEEVASMPVAGATAANALFFGPNPIRPGMTVLTQGTGGVSCFAIQLASSAGATVISTSSSTAKLQTAKALGATHLINYQTHPNWEEEVLRLTNGKGVDHVIENGGAATIKQSLKATKRGGVISLIGFLAGKASGLDDAGLGGFVAEVLYGGKTLRGVCGNKKAHTVEMVERFEKYALHPAIAKVFEWEDAKEAFRYSMSYAGVGKTVIKV